jgi:hypothetical protein
MTMLLGYRRMKDFFTSLPWWDLDPRPELAGDGTRVLTKPGELYVAYAANGGALSVRLAAGEYEGRWYNPRTGAWSSAPAVTAKSDEMWKSPDPADRGDWALVLRRMGD